MSNLTTKQRHILQYIDEFIENNGDSPSLFEIQKFMGVKSLSTVHQYIKAIEEKGYLQKDSTAARGITYIMNAGKYIGQMIKIPMVGTIIAGYPIDAIEQISEYIKVPLDLKLDRNLDYYALKVRGDSMKDSYIAEGDIVIVLKTTIVKNGEMVVALTKNGEATLKHFYLEGDMIRLQPANIEYKSILIPKGDLQIQGKVIQVLRYYY